MIKKLICIRCPQGCEISTTLDGYGNITEITGNTCKLGIDYANSEIKDPRRTLTTTVRVEGGELPLCPVWTESPVPKEKVLELAKKLSKITLKAPVEHGQTVLDNVFGTRVIAAREVKRLISSPLSRGEAG